MMNLVVFISQYPFIEFILGVSVIFILIFLILRKDEFRLLKTGYFDFRKKRRIVLKLITLNVALILYANFSSTVSSDIRFLIAICFFSSVVGLWMINLGIAHFSNKNVQESQKISTLISVKLKNYIPATGSKLLHNIKVVHLVIFLTLIQILLIDFRLFEFAGIQYDDSFIAFRYADNLASHGQLRFNLEDSANSATSLTFVVLLSVVHLITTIPIPVVSNFLNVISLVLLNFVVTKLILNKFVSNYFRCFNLFIYIMVTTNPYLTYWMFSGMETVFFVSLSATLFLGTIFAHQGGSKRIRILITLGVVLLVCSRPEGMALIISFAFPLLFSGDKELKRRAVQMLITSISAFCCLFVFYLLYYGSFLPDPVVFKPLTNYYGISEYQSLRINMDFIQNRIFGLFLISFILFSVALWWFRLLTQKNKSLLFSVFFLGCSQLFLSTLSAYSDEYRYQIPLLSAILIQILTLTHILEGLDKENFRSFGSFKKKTFHARMLVTPSASLLTICLIFFPSYLVQYSTKKNPAVESTQGLWYIQEERKLAGLWMAQNLRPGSKIVAGDIGGLSFYFQEGIFLDVTGLVNRSVLNGLGSRIRPCVILAQQIPDYIADTAGVDGVTAAESLLNYPENYYKNLVFDTNTICAQISQANKKVVFVSKQNFDQDLIIQISKWRNSDGKN